MNIELKKITVAVSQRVDNVEGRSETRDALDQRLVEWLLQLGCLPIPVPNKLIKVGLLENWLEEINPQAVVLSGGNDIGKNLSRDLTETALLEYAKERQIPVLGICRGMQIMGHCYGATLSPANGHIATRHQLSGEITGTANSFHGFALRECPKGFFILARSEDGVIEAIRHNSLPWEGWMWHPEREAEFAVRDIQRLKALFHMGSA